MSESKKESTPVPVDSVELALAEAEVALKRDRTRKIGALLDKATDVLLTVLNTEDAEHESARMGAASMAINLYTADQSNQRADRQLDLQSKRLEIMAKKLGIGALFFQQNNYNELAQAKDAPKMLVRQEDGSVVDVDLLARKKAQQMILDAQLGIMAESILSSKHGETDDED